MQAVLSPPHMEMSSSALAPSQSTSAANARSFRNFLASSFVRHPFFFESYLRYSVSYSFAEIGAPAALHLPQSVEISGAYGGTGSNAHSRCLVAHASRKCDQLSECSQCRAYNSSSHVHDSVTHNGEIGKRRFLHVTSISLLRLQWSLQSS